MDRENGNDSHSGLLGGLIGIAKNMVGLVTARIELAAFELGEIRDNLAKLLLFSALAIVALLFAATCWTALVIVLAWEALGWKILLLTAIAYTLLAVAFFYHVRGLLKQGRLSMPATMNELRNDRDALL